MILLFLIEYHGGRVVVKKQLQVSLVYINTLMLQNVLGEAPWRSQMTDRDMAALTPLVHAHINPYGIFELDMSQRLALENLLTAA